VFASTFEMVTEFPWRVEIAAKLDDINSRAKITSAELCLRILISSASTGQ
jgi:hypothetical protein